MENAIITVDLTKRFGEFVAVDHVSFEVGQGEVFGFLGPNGAGKSTTIRMLTGVSTPTEGTARIMGYDIVKQSVDAKSLMGVVPDISNIYDELSAWENLIFTAKLYGISKMDREERARDLLKRFDLHDRRDIKVGEFSRGMKRRVCIAMALVNESKVLFLDEPTAGLDVKSVRHIHDLIHSLNDEGLTIFLATHNMEEASQMCDRVAIINRGKIAALDTPEKLKRAMKSSQSIEVAFKEAKPEALKGLEALPSFVEVQKRGDKLRLLTDDPVTALKELWSFVQENDLELLTLNTLGPSLEDAFLQLTGTEMEKESLKKWRGPKR